MIANRILLILVGAFALAVVLLLVASFPIRVYQRSLAVGTPLLSLWYSCLEFVSDFVLRISDFDLASQPSD